MHASTRTYRLHTPFYIVERENVACRVCAAHPQEEWGQWSQPSEPFRTLPEGAKQPTAPAVKLREAGALVVRLPKRLPQNRRLCRHLLP